MNKPMLFAVIGLAGMVVAARADEPILIGHRGLLHQMPENTLPAFAGCLERGFGFELDIRTSNDGHFFVLHDDSLRRTTDGPDRPARDFSLDELKKLDAGAWFDPKFTGVRIPSLEEVFALIKQRKRGPTIIALNVKDISGDGEKELVSLVEEYGLLDESFAFDQSPECSRRFKQFSAKFRIGGNVSRKTLAERLDEGLFDVFLLTFVPTPEETALLHRHGKQVLFNFSGDGQSRRNPTVWNQVKAAGIDGLLTDFPIECQQCWRK